MAHRVCVRLSVRVADMSNRDGLRALHKSREGCWSGVMGSEPAIDVQFEWQEKTRRGANGSPFY